MTTTGPEASVANTPTLDELRRLRGEMKPAAARMLRFRDELLRRGIDPDAVMEAFKASKADAAGGSK